MRKVKILSFFLIAFLTSCANLQSPKTPQQAINEAYITLTAIVQQVEANRTAGTMSVQERDDVLAEVKKYEATVDQAQALLKAGNPQASQQQLALVNSALLALNKRIADKARK